VKRWLGLAELVVESAAGVDLRVCVWGAGSGVLVPNEVEAGVEALVSAAARVKKTASGRSTAYPFIGTFNFPERRFRW
jgi:hypothetical protein